MLNTDQFAATNKANLEILINLTNKAFEGVEQLTALNLQVVRTSLDEAAEASVAALSAKDPQAALSLQSFQPAADKAAAYGRQVYEIIASTKAQFDKVAADSASSAQNSLLAAFEAATKNAPEGSASGLALFKSAVAATNNAIEGMKKATQQATDVAEANYAAVTSSAKPSKAKRG
jgi:phasin family protein